MRLTFRVLGYELFSIELAKDEYVLEEESPEGISGGSGHNFERDMEPIDAQGEEPWVYGFGLEQSSHPL